MQLESKPSKPSIKFMEFIRKVLKNIEIKKIIKPSIETIGVKELNNDDVEIIIVPVINWTVNLLFADKWYLSSIKPVIERGRHIKGKKKFNLKLIKTLNKTKTIPPPVGVSFVCELLSLGLSIKPFFKIGIV